MKHDTPRRIRKQERNERSSHKRMQRRNKLDGKDKIAYEKMLGIR